MLSKQLTKAGCIVHVVNHGEEALAFLQTSVLWRSNNTGYALDIVLMDLEMPVMDGLTCSRRNRELQDEGSLIRHVPLIAVTANVRKEQVETAVTAGMVRSGLAIYQRMFLSCHVWKGLCNFRMTSCQNHSG